jgi:hypothetical protein
MATDVLSPRYFRTVTARLICPRTLSIVIYFQAAIWQPDALYPLAVVVVVVDSLPCPCRGRHRVAEGGVEPQGGGDLGLALLGLAGYL